MNSRILLSVGGIFAAIFASRTELRAEAAASDQPPVAKAPHLTAKDVFDYRGPVIFQDNFQSGRFGKWGLSEDDRYGILHETPSRIKIVDLPGLTGGSRAVRFNVPRAPNSFRAELALPSEAGFHERWYGERILVPDDWVYDANRGADIVMQWHGIPGNWRATFPNLDIAISNHHWLVHRNYGAAQTGPTRTTTQLDDPVKRGVWVSWVIHAKWSPRGDGLVQIWRDGKLAAEFKGANVYGTIGVDYTPYLKTGIYHPEWHMDKPAKAESFQKEIPGVTGKIIYISDVKVGGEGAAFDDVSPDAKAAAGSK